MASKDLFLIIISERPTAKRIVQSLFQNMIQSQKKQNNTVTTDFHKACREYIKDLETCVFLSMVFSVQVTDDNLNFLF